MINNIGTLGNQALNLSGSSEAINDNKEKNLSFDSLLNTISSIEQNQLQTRTNIHTMLKTGEGDTHEALIAMNKATSQIKTAAVIRDKVLESYQTIMSMQI